MKYRRIYRLLVTYGHSPFKANEIVLDASRGDKHSRRWIRTIFDIERCKLA